MVKFNPKHKLILATSEMPKVKTSADEKHFWEGIDPTYFKNVVLNGKGSDGKSTVPAVVKMLTGKDL